MSKYQRRYVGKTDWQPWKPVDVETARRVLAQVYADVELVFEALDAGHEVRTPFAQYRATPEPKEDA